MKAIGFGVAAALSCLVVTSAGAQDTKRLMTFEELLNAETLGGAEFSPDGKSLEITRVMPATQHPSWGYVDASRVRSRVFVTQSNGAGIREVASTADIRYAPVAAHLWSPDGRGIALIASRRDGYGLAYYDLATKHITQMSGRPLYATMAWLPDGRIVYPSLPEGQRQRDLSATLLSGLGRHWQAAWTSDVPQVTVSSSSAVFPDKPGPVGALLLADSHTGATKVLARGDFIDIATAPDDRHIAAISEGEDLASSSSRTGKRSALELFELNGNSARLIYHDDNIDAAAYGGMSWSPSGQKFIFEGRPIRDAQGHAIDYGRDLTSGMVLYEFDVRDGKLRLLSGEGVSQGNPDINDSNILPIGWIGEHPVAVGAHKVQGAVSALANMPGRTQLDYGGMRDTRFDVFAYDGAQVENLTSFSKASVQQFLAPKDGDFAYVVADGVLWKVSPGKPAQRMSPADAPMIAGFAVDRRNPMPPVSSAYYHSGATERVSLVTVSGHAVGRSVYDFAGKFIPGPAPTDVLVTAPDQFTTVTKVADGWSTSLTLNDGSAKTIMTLNEKLKDRAVAPVERFTYAYNGQTLTGWLVLPPGAKPGSKLPAIVSVYGGAVYGDQPPSFARTDFPLPIFSGQVLAEQGYAVIYPSTPLGAGADTDLMATLANEVVAAIDALAANGTIDPARVGLTGQSFGGFSTAAILAERSDRFKAGVAMAGVYDWMHGYGLRSNEDMFNDDDNMSARETMLIESGQSRLGKPFWEVPDAYMRNSPIFRADKIDAPLLLLHGDLDLAVTGLTGAERLYNAMLRAGKHPTLVHYWGEGHVAEGAGAIRDQWMRLTTWFAYYVKGERQ